MRKAFSPEEYQKREKLITDTALSLLEEKNFSNITMRELARACGVAIGTLFNYYPTKELLFRKLLYDYYNNYFTEEISEIEKQTFYKFEDYKNFQLQRVSVLIEQHTLIALLSVHHNVYTVSEGTEALNEERLLWANKLIDIGRLTHEKLPRIPAESATRFYYFLHALLVGYSNLFQVPGMSQPPLFIDNLREETLLSVEYYLDGMQNFL